MGHVDNGVLILDINHGNDVFEIRWADGSWFDLIKFYRHQTGTYNWTEENPPLSEFISVATNRVTNDFNRLMRGIGNPAGASRILDIGSGVGILDILLYQKLSVNGDGPTMYLLDKDEFTLPKTIYANDVSEYGFYNSWKPFENAIETTGLNRSKFVTMGPLDEWPTDLDLIFSTYSWCWHYPPSTYINQVLQGLKAGGMLVLDVINRRDNDDIGEISEALGAKPETFDIVARHIKPGHFLYDKLNIENGIIGKTCRWIKQR